MKRWRIVTAGVLIAVALLLYAAPRFIEKRFNQVLQSRPFSASSQATVLHQKLLIVDLHADSLLWSRDLSKKNTVGHVDLQRLSEGNVAIQAFTVVTQFPSGANIRSKLGGSDLIRPLAVLEGWPFSTWTSLKARALYQAHRLQALQSPRFVILRSASDLQRFLERRQKEPITAGFLGIEGAQALEGNLDNLQAFYDAGFRMMSPSHFVDTDLGGSASGVRKGGLTEVGRSWVREMERRNMLIDLAHASPATIRDITSIATKPLVVSHTGVKGTCNNNRNLSDDELRAVARTGGVIGIGYWETAVCGKDSKAIAKAIRYAVTIVGVDHVALGSDFDGATTMPFDVTGLPQVTEALLEEGFSEREIRLIMGENTVRVLKQTLPRH